MMLRCPITLIQKIGSRLLRIHRHCIVGGSQQHYVLNEVVENELERTVESSPRY